MKCKINIDGKLPKAIGIDKKSLREISQAFAGFSSRRIKREFREVTIILQHDEESAEVHLAINGAEGPTDVITQAYDPMPGEEDGVYGELYINVDQALRIGKKSRAWSPKKELLLYVAHGIDHLSGADDLNEKGYQQMRRRELNWLRLYL